MTESSTNNKVLEVKDLKTYFYTDNGIVKAVDGVSFDLKKAWNSRGDRIR